MTAGAPRRKQRVGLIGYGFIGRQVFARLQADPALEAAFVHNRGAAALADVLPGLRLEDLSAAAGRRADLVVEMAHPDFTRRWGESLLRHGDYLPLSVTALADDALRARLLAAAREHGTRLLIPHGALIGTDNLVEGRAQWREVSITFWKNPAHIDFSESGIDGLAITSESVVYEGPVRGIAALFPRNVNTMVTCALATTGLDACRARLVAVPGSERGRIRIEALGHDGSRLVLEKEQPMAGVSGTEMFESQWRSIRRAAGVLDSPDFV
jgi:predicted dinucleotide-utilizing enzyme